MAVNAISTPSPQLSLAEFLQDDPSLEGERKHRRKKERSSLFFRKKKDKPGINNSSANVNGKPTSIQHHALFEAQQKGGLAKVSSSINLGGNSRGSGAGSKAENQGQIGSKMSQHSHSMSSLRKASISAPHHSQTVPLPPPVPMGSNSNFYLAKTDFSKNYADENDLGHEEAGLLESEFMPGEEFAEGGGPAAIRDLETPRHLRIEEEEPETWTQTVSAKTLSKLTSADIKRQEHIYEFILTESNHCQVLKVIQKIFVEGMFKYLSLSKDIVDRIFPQIDTLIDLHFRFLEELRARQNQEAVVNSIADILHAQFSGETGERWREAYGTFCSGHNEAVSVFKDLMKSDRRFQQFVRQCSENPLLKKKGVPECILFVTTRITKYPLLIESLIKAAIRDRPAEFEWLRQSNIFVKDILKDINARVAEKERKHRLFEIYNKIDPKANLVQLGTGRKFKKSDILLADRKLMFEGKATLQQARNRTQEVNVIVLSDILFFLHENNQKFYFCSPDILGGKPSIVSVKTLIARERPGGSSKSLNLLSTEGFEQEPEVYELEIMQPPTRDDWITDIREAVDAASPGSDSDPDEDYTKSLRKSVDDKYLRLRRLTAELRGKDIELSKVLESKMKIMYEILDIVQGDGYEKPVVKTEYINLVREKKLPGTEVGDSMSKEQLLVTVQEASRLASSIYSSVTNLSRSVSSAGEKHSNVYSSPSLPRRAETFSGFDKELTNQKPKIKEIEFGDGGEREIIVSNQNSQIPQIQSESAQAVVSNSKPDIKLSGPQPLLMTLEPEQQQAATQLTHYMNTVMCLVAEHFTSLESIKNELSEIQEKANISGGRYKQNQRFEEMRVLQDKLAQEKKEWKSERETLKQEVEAKKQEKIRYQSEIDRDLKDVKEQREQLYRKLEVLRAQGIELGPNLSILKTDPAVLPSKSSPGEFLQYKETIASTPTLSPNLAPSSGGGSASSIRKSSSLTSSSSAILTASNNILTGGSLKKESFANLHLMSATNETKAMDKMHEIKQQIPTKLSSLSNLSGKVSKKSVAASSSSALNAAAITTTSSASNLSAASNVSGSKGISNLAVKPEMGQQQFPFKLSEAGDASSKPSPKHQQQQLHSSGSSRYHTQPGQPQYYHQFEQSRRSGSPPQPMVYQQHHHHQQQQKEQQKQQRKQQHGGSLRYTNSNNTLPKSSGGNIQKVTNYGSNSGGGGGSSGANSDDDKVIYF